MDQEYAAIQIQGSGLGSTIIDCEGASWAFQFINNEGPDSMIRDLTIANSTSPNAVAIIGASPTFVSVEFVNNLAPQVSGAAIEVAGVWVFARKAIAAVRLRERAIFAAPREGVSDEGEVS